MIARAQMGNLIVHQKTRLLLMLVVGVIGGAGCGSGAGSSSLTTPSAGDFIARLDAACREDVAAIKAAPRTTAALAAAQHKFIQKLEALTPSRALRPVYSQYVSLLKRNLAAVERHDVAASKQLKAEIAPLAAKLKSAGATSC